MDTNASDHHKKRKKSSLNMAHKVQRLVSNDLRAIIGKDVATKGECMEDLWVYMKENKLQCNDYKQYFLPDKKMSKIFGKGKVRKLSMGKYIEKHLSPIEDTDTVDII